MLICFHNKRTHELRLKRIDRVNSTKDVELDARPQILSVINFANNIGKTNRCL